MVNPVISCLLDAKVYALGKTAVMTRLVLVLCVCFSCLSVAAQAQSGRDLVWVQIEARPTYDAALARVERYAATLPDVAGFSLAGGWYAVVLGPYTPEDAEQVLTRYRQQGLIPNDSYVALSSSYAQQYWPAGVDVLGLGAIGSLSERITPQIVPPVLAGEQTAQLDNVDGPVDTETPAQARRNESQLTAAQRRELQTALQWAGVYNAAIDGAFGRGTRNAMATWQRNNGLEATGVLTTQQRARLIAAYTAILDGLDMRMVRDSEAGISIQLPTAVMRFTRYEAPFAEYDGTGDFKARAFLISQRGDRDALAALYDILQTLTIVPLEGPRSLSRNSFQIVGRGADFVSETDVRLIGDEIKGFTLVWPVDDEARRSRVLQEMRASFQSTPGVLDPSAGVPASQQLDLFAGIDVRKPTISRSGFYVDAAGSVVTTAAAVESCARITLDDEFEATLTGVDLNRGIALLTPNQSLAPPVFAQFSAQPPRLQSDIAVAGYSFEGQLSAPSLTFGKLSDMKGLSGETDLGRLSVQALPGDAGGPVLDSSGSVLGMLLPKEEGTRQLPEDVRFALTGQAIGSVMTQAGLTLRKGAQTAGMDPKDITDLGVGMTVLVSCWE